ncbi:MAG: carboxypeptidase regulatory-like domain-containing protein, partial [Planctomycetes bacterium]|nr:carboxypeptidase regulatory-like domain-containing protein [Planctomycetota bacterium]
MVMQPDEPVDLETASRKLAVGTEGQALQPRRPTDDGDAVREPLSPGDEVTPEPIAPDRLEQPLLVVRTLDRDTKEPLGSVLLGVRGLAELGQIGRVVVTGVHGTRSLSAGRVDFLEVFVPALMGTDLAVQRFTFEEGLTQQVDLEVPNDRRVAIRTIDGVGRPVAGAELTIGYARRDLSRVALSDAEGRFTLHAAPSVIYASAKAPGLGRSRIVRIELPAGVTTEYDLTIEAATSALVVAITPPDDLVSPFGSSMNLVPIREDLGDFHLETVAQPDSLRLQASELPAGRYRVNV